MNTTMSTDDLLLALAQDLREYADAAAEAGQPIDITEGLLAEVDAHFAPPPADHPLLPIPPAFPLATRP